MHPYDILKKLLILEKSLGRKREFKNVARNIDFDLLCYVDLVMKTTELELPHPRIHMRSFVLKPICELDPAWSHPIIKKRADVLLKSLSNQKIFLKKT